MSSLKSNKKYVESAINLVFEYSLFKDKLNKNRLHSETIGLLNGADKNSLYNAYDHLIEELRRADDNHSKIRKPDYTSTWKGNETPVTLPDFKIMDNVCVISVPPFIGIDEERCITYASKLQQILSKNDEIALGWIIDLRGNGGGNMAPMVVGVGPLYDSNIVGYFKSSSGSRTSWGYKNGAYLYDRKEMWRIPTPVRISQPKPIAILLDKHTASSAEMLAISFKGNANTKFFGTHTKGLTTVNASFELGDGSMLFLATTNTLSRDKIEYTGSVQPDELTESPLETAVEWVGSSQSSWRVE